jgi:hypothetical protein
VLAIGGFAQQRRPGGAPPSPWVPRYHVEKVELSGGGGDFLSPCTQLLETAARHTWQGLPRILTPPTQIPRTRSGSCAGHRIRENILCTKSISLHFEPNLDFGRTSTNVRYEGCSASHVERARAAPASTLPRSSAFPLERPNVTVKLSFLHTILPEYATTMTTASL